MEDEETVSTEHLCHDVFSVCTLGEKEEYIFQILTSHSPKELSYSFCHQAKQKPSNISGLDILWV
jgi:hypothetical protein